MLCQLLKVLCQLVGKQENHVGTHAVSMLHTSHDQRYPI